MGKIQQFGHGVAWDPHINGI